ncbi:hypothetical protein PAMA_011985 [Pampus argenteus]
MSRLQSLKRFVQQRLTAAVEEIFGHFEKTITEYEEEMSRRHRELLEEVSELRRAVFPADVQQLLESKEEVPPEQQERSSSLDQEEPEPPHIKEEQEELWTSQEGEQLQGLEEAGITTFTFTPVPVKSEDDEEEPQRIREPPACSSTQMKTESEDNCGASEPASNFDPDSYLQPVSEEQTWMEARDPLSGLKALNNNIVNDNIVNKLLEEECDGPKSFICPQCDKRFERRETLNRHMRCHTGEKPYSCLVCKRLFRWRADFVTHLRTHTGEKPFMCSDCGKCFIKHGTLTRHMRTHTGERPHVCSVCGNGFHRKEDLTKHTRTHTGEKPFSCTVCNRQFSRSFRVKNHKCVVESSNT